MRDIEARWNNPSWIQKTRENIRAAARKPGARRPDAREDLNSFDDGACPHPLEAMSYP
jgi:hypothetical protein